MIHKTIVVGPLQCNCVLLGCEKTREAVLIDPGDEPRKIVQLVRDLGLNVKYLLHTHAHFDHIGGTKGVKKEMESTVCLHKEDELIYNNLPMQGQMFGMQFESAPAIEKFLEDEEILSFGEHRLQVLHTPGHSPGSVCLKLLDGDESVFSGDTLFRESIGRADLWGGDYQKLLTSIRNRLFVLNGEIQVFPGHGPSTKIDHEKKNNPFFR